MNRFKGCFSLRVSTCLFIFTLCGGITGAPNEPVKVKEGNDVILPCSLSTKEDIEFKLFDWKKDGQKEVFLYDGGVYYDNGLSGQDKQFKGRVSHFSDQLKNGVASIKIQNTKVADSGNYTCVFPRLQPSQTFHIELVVVVVEPVKVTVKEDSDAILPCSLSTKENIKSKLFDWKKDGQKEVFLFNSGPQYNNPLDGQDPQFRGRVFHFQDELKHGNASIIIRDTTAADSGNYTCVFPRLQPSQTFHIELVVVGAAAKPSVSIIDQTNDRSLLQCEVLGAFPEPKVEWKDSSGNTVPAEDPKVTKRGDKYDVILQTTVTKTDHYHCEATQKEIHHQIDSKIFVHINGSPTGWIFAAVLGFLLSAILVLVLLRKRLREKRFWRHENGSENPPGSHHELECFCKEPPITTGSDVSTQTDEASY